MTLMWEAKAAEGRLDELVAYVLEHVDPAAQVYRSHDGRVVAIDPTGRGVDDVPPDLVDRPAHAWAFDEVDRH